VSKLRLAISPGSINGSQESIMKRQIAAIMILAVAVGSFAWAQPDPPFPRGGGMGWKWGSERGDMAERLDLTAEQQQKLRSLRSEFQRTLVRVQADLRLARIDMRDLMEAEKPDKASIAKKMKEISDTEYRQKSAWLDHYFSVRGLLTPDQLEKFRKMQRGMGPGFMRGGPPRGGEDDVMENYLEELYEVEPEKGE
jgi:Spy/CpxP family protein refolding chaperone